MGTPDHPTDRAPGGPATGPGTLRDAVKDLSVEVERLAKVAERAMPRATARRTVRTVIVGAVITLIVTLGAENLLIRNCFLGPPPGGMRRTVCGLFPGYEQSRAATDERLAKFGKLIDPESPDSVLGLLGRVAELERRAGVPLPAVPTSTTVPGTAP